MPTGHITTVVVIYEYIEINNHCFARKKNRKLILETILGYTAMNNKYKNDYVKPTSILRIVDHFFKDWLINSPNRRKEFE